MFFNSLPGPIRATIDLFFGSLIVLGAILFLLFAREDPAQSRQTEDLRLHASAQTGLHCVRVIMAEAGAIDCYDGSGRRVLFHTDAAGWVQISYVEK